MLMRTNLLIGLAVAALVLAGCKTPTRVDKGPIKASTFSFLRPGPLPEAAYAESRQQIHGLIQEAIANNLAAKGVRAVAAGGDVTVAYLIIVGNNVSTSEINDYFGYTPDALALGDKAQKAYTSNSQRNFFEAGTLLIDIVDSRTQKVLARNYATRPLLQNPPLDVRKARIQEVVNEVLSPVRFEH
jgi:uncharacterized lipoprotein YajG